MLVWGELIPCAGENQATVLVWGELIPCAGAFRLHHTQSSILPKIDELIVRSWLKVPEVSFFAAPAGASSL